MSELNQNNISNNTNESVQYYPLTSPQKIFWYTGKLYPNTSMGNVAATLRFKGQINYKLLEEAINIFIQKNDGLRLRITEIDHEPKQYISDFAYHELDLFDFSGKDIDELYKWDESLTKVPFQIIDSDLFYFALVKVNEQDGGIYVKTNHLISDAWTMSLLGNGIVKYYGMLKNLEEIPEEKKLSYVEYIQAEKDYMNSDRFEKDKKYWISKYEYSPEQTSIKATDLKNIDRKARRKTLLIPKRLTDAINNYCKENKASVYTLFISALSMYINRVTGNEHIILGTTTLNRANSREKQIVGVFSNITSIQIDINDDMDFHTLVANASKESLSMLRHQKYPYNMFLKELREKLGITHDMFDVILNYQNSKFNKDSCSQEYKTRWHFNGYQNNNLIIHINDREDEGYLIVDYDYLIDLFHAKEVEFIHQHVVNFLWHALDNPTKKISKLDMLSEREKNKILYEFNSPQIISEKDDTLRSLFEGQAIKHYILDRNLNLMPIGIEGELYISISKDNTTPKLVKDNEPIENPFEQEGEIYKTGYVARWYPEGDIKQLEKKENKKKIEEIQVRVTATFTAELIGKYMEWWCKNFGYELKIKFAGYNQVFQELLDSNSLLAKNKNGINILLVRFEDFIRSDNGTEEAQIIKLKQVFQELSEAVDEFGNTAPLIVAIFPVSTHLNLSRSLQSQINKLNADYKEMLLRYNNIYLVDLNDTQELFGIEEVFDNIKDKEGHMPFSEEYYAAIGTELARKICAIKKQHFKVIVLDCDNTLWQGICGERGALGVKVEGSYRELQNFMLQKHSEGFLLAICSKNNEEDVFEVFETNPGMVLKKEHIANWKINWNEKSQNIKEIASELNLGLDSFIYIDDSSLECSKMVERFPEVLTLQLPSDRELIPLFLKHVWAFDKVKVTKEDTIRTRMYIAEKKRKEIKDVEKSLDDFIKNLELKVSMRTIKDHEISRAVQLTQRTNQFNLSTIRRTEEEIKKLTMDSKTKCFVIEASDKFGDYGIVGLVILKNEGGKLFIDTFLLSCRILGRKVEDVILSGVRKYALEQGIEKIETVFVPTEKNKLILDFIERLQWNIIEQENSWIRYNADVSTLPEELDYVDFYYNEMYEKKHEIIEISQSKEAYILDHVAIAVRNIKESENYYQMFGYSITKSVYDPLQNSILSMCNSNEFLPVELVAPVDEKSPSYNLVEVHGEIPYHLCYRVPNIKKFLEKIVDIGYELISKEKPAVLFNNQKVAFIMLKKVGLIELVETGAEQSNKNDSNKFNNNIIRIIVNDFEKALNLYKVLGYTFEKNIKDEKNNLLVAMLIGVQGEKIELVLPLNEESAEYMFLKKKGAGIYQIRFEVDKKTYIRMNENNIKIQGNRDYNVFYVKEKKKLIKSIDYVLCDTKSLEGLRYKEYALPLINFLGKKLLQLPIYEGVNYTTSKYEAPRNGVEEILAEAWKQTLKVEGFGINDSFFELGGDSLGVLQIISILYKHNIQIRIQDVYKYSTIGELGRIIELNNQSNEKGLTEKTEGKVHDCMSLEHIEYTKIQFQPLANLVKSGELPPVDGVALLYDTDNVIVPFIEKNQQMFQTNLGDAPFPYNFVNMGFGTILVIFLPILAKELYSEKNRLISLCKEGIKLAEKLGAKTVSLAGLIPSATEYGIDVIKSFENDMPGVKITIGHATISAGVVLAIERLLDESKRILAEEKLCVIGLDFTGKLILKLFLSVLPHPASITLCDVYGKNENLSKLKKELKEELGFKNEINTVVSKGLNLPDEIYDSSLIIGAINIPDIIDVNKLQAGTLIIDDVWTNCYSKDKAIDRFKNDGDILFNDGRFLESPNNIHRTIYLPEFMGTDIVEEYKQHFLAKNEIVGCMLSSLMCAKFDELKPLIGNIDFKEAVMHYKRLKKLGFKGAYIHCNDFIASESDIENFNRFFGNKKLLK